MSQEVWLATLLLAQQPARWMHLDGAEREEPRLCQSWEAECGQLEHRICRQGVPRQNGAWGEEGGRRQMIQFRRWGPASRSVKAEFGESSHHLL